MLLCSRIIIGELPEDSQALPKRELDDGSFAFSGEDRSLEELGRIPGFVIAKATDKHTWKDSKTWRKK